MVISFSSFSLLHTKTETHIHTHMYIPECALHRFLFLFLLSIIITSISVHPSHWGQISLWSRHTTNNPASQLYLFPMNIPTCVNLPTGGFAWYVPSTLTLLISDRQNWTYLSRSTSKPASSMKPYSITPFRSEISFLVLSRITENTYCFDSKGSN